MTDENIADLREEIRGFLRTPGDLDTMHGAWAKDLLKRAAEALRDAEPTLRDRFAMAIIDSMIRAADDMEPPRETARYAYDYADAMLAERKLRGETEP